MNQIFPSILAANFMQLPDQLCRLKKMGVDTLHLDVMDGHFVPNLTFGPDLIRQIRNETDMFLETHLMIESPRKWIEEYAEAGSDAIIFHYEADNIPEETLDKIASLGLKRGISIKPNTPTRVIEKLLTHVDLVLLMTVYPGFGGQSYLSDSNGRIARLQSILNGTNVILEVDGGIDSETIRQAKLAGAERFIAGSAVFKDNQLEENLEKLVRKLRSQ